jgi:hypothetical protein
MGSQFEYVDLGRHFHQFTEKELGDEELLAASNEHYGWSQSLSWADLLARKRVVVLASAGSGKTEEMVQMTKKLVGDKKNAFYVRLEELAGANFEALLKHEDIELLKAWRESASAQAWFFLDSVDELKLTQRSLESALRSLSRALPQGLGRAHIIVSSRPTDWRVQIDEAKLREWIPVPVVKEVSERSSDEMFRQALSRHEQKESRKKSGASLEHDQSITTVLLLPLSDRHIREFARQRGVADADAFVQEITKQNAWSFARRPLDLIELITVWLSKRKLGTKQEQHGFNLEIKLNDKPDRADAGKLSGVQAEDGAERLALAMALTRRRSIKPPDLHVAVPSDEAVLDATRVLNHWPPDSTSALLRRAIFDPATLGRVRFHHQSIQEFLAARRLCKLKEKGMSVQSLFRLLFADKYGERVVIPSMTPIAAWLSLWDAAVFRELVSRSPESLIMHGDPGSLSLGQRRALISAFVRRYGDGGWRGFRLPADQLRRIASPELSALIKDSWGSKPENREVRELLLDLIEMGPVPSGVGIAFKTACDRNEEQHLRIYATRALVACGALQRLKTITTQMLTKPTLWPAKLISAVLPQIFPLVLNEDELITLLERHESRGLRGNSDGYEWALRGIVSEESKAWDRFSVRRRLTQLIKEGCKPGASWHEVQSRYRDYCSALAMLCFAELEASAGFPGDELLDSCAVAYHLCGREVSDDPIKNLHSWFRDRHEIRERTFWSEVSLMDAVATAEDSWDRFWNTMHHSLCDSVTEIDKAWVEAALFKDDEPKKQEIAVQAWINIWSIQGRKTRELLAIRQRLSERHNLITLLESRTKKSKDSKSMRRYAAQAKQQQAKWDAEEKQRMAGWEKWRHELMRSPEQHFAESRVLGTISNIFKWLNQNEASSSSNGVWNYKSVVNIFGQAVADMAKEAFKHQWRTVRPELWTERIESERNSTPCIWIYGLCGLMAESESPGWTVALTPDEARLAARYATVEMNQFAPFLKELAENRPSEVEQELGAALEAELLRGGEYSHLSALQNLTHADLVLKKLLSPRLETFLVQQKAFSVKNDQNHWHHNLNQLLGILSETCSTVSAKKIGRFCCKQLMAGGTNPMPILWLRGVFQFTSDEAPEILIEWCKKRGSKSDSLPLQAIASLFGDHDGVGLPIKDPDLRARALGKLVRFAYRIVRPQDDAVHEGVYTPDARDDAERGRGFLLSALLETPGAVARQIITQLSGERAFSHFADRLRHLARERAAKDAEFEAWEVGQIEDLNQQFDLPPTGRDAMHQVMMDRLEDLQHDLDHDDFSNRRTLQTISDETEMQRCLAQKLQAMSRGAYAIEREAEVADAKKPDIRLRSMSDGTKAAIEIKIADNRWSLLDLEQALKKQLVGQYLRHESCRSGCLLLTFAGRKKKWMTASGKALNAVQLVDHLNKVADSIEKRRSGSIRVRVVGIWLNGSTTPLVGKW